MLGGSSLWAQTSLFDVKEADLVGVLQSGQPAEKAVACKKLAVVGTDKAVPELAKLLADEQLSSWARIALEAIPGSAPDEALRKAQESLKGRLLVGTINSIGVRRDAAAVEALTGRLKDEDAQVAAAAAVALGKIGNDAATQAVRQALSGGSAEVRSAAAEGCILCAERLIADKASAAVAIYDEVRKADVAKPRKLEATRGAILARKLEGIPLLVEQLQSNDKAFVNIGLAAARELPGSEVDDALAAELTKTTPERAALLLYALADRQPKAMPAAVLAAAKSGEKPVRIAALGFIGRLGDEKSLDTLLGVATESDADVSKAAKEALADLPGDKVNGEITSRLTKADKKTLPVVIELVGKRRIDATAALRKALDDPDKSVRTAALAALGATIGQKDLAVLISQVVSPKQADQADAAHQALLAACVRMPDREACAAELAAAMQRAPTETKTKLLEVLGAMGGKKSLDTIAAAMKSNSDELQDAGSRLLGEWMSVDAAPVLLDLAKSSSTKYQIRALRGYIRLARQFQVPDPERAEMCQKALDAAMRPDEQKLVMVVLERYPSADTLRVAVKAGRVAALKSDANRVALAIAQKLIGPSATVQDALSKVGAEPVKVEILKASYGAGTQQKDVTELLAQRVGTSPLIALAKPTYNEVFGGDPAPNTKKVLHVQYRVNGKAGEATFDENAVVLLPMPK
jgi:HEAT repeat protein